MMTAYAILAAMGIPALAFVLWYDYWYTPRHTKQSHTKKITTTGCADGNLKMNKPKPAVHQ